jgi:uncharacterized damage-inducible protein DinB
MSTDPLPAAAREILGETFEQIVQTLDGLGAEQLNARLDLEGANPLCVVAVHASYSARWWTALAMGRELPARDRAAEFRTVVEDADAFRSGLRAVHDDTRALLDGEASVGWEVPRETHYRRSDGSEESVTGAFALVHAVEHAREHVAQMWLTRQALEDGRLTRPA